MMSVEWARVAVGVVLSCGLLACGGGVETTAGSTTSSGAGGATVSSTASSGGAGADAGCTAEIEPSDGGPPVCNGPGSRFVSRVVSTCFGAGQNVGQDALPAVVAGPPKGGGCCSGSLDVCSLGNGGSITLAFDGNAIVDGPGPDFIVFENAFDVGSDPKSVYAELATVEVSADGVTWHAFPCTATAYPYGSCAGWHPVLANADDNDIDPLDPATAGGDAFDLADLGVSLARFVRITDRPDLPSVFDLDAVAIVNAACP
ncbi:Cell surface protein [Minicystis rosea]|nr:Cell surface protein [Minicystis rosea]